MKLLDQKSQLGFYFHIPFCPHICPYCDFTKTSHFSIQEVIAYFHALDEQLEFFLENVLYKKETASFSQLQQLQEKEFVTVYFGGGTPSLFPSRFYSSLLTKLCQYYQIEEATIETNPHTNMERFFSDYRSIGFDRVTLGAQSLCSQTLKTLGRKHSAASVLKNVYWAQRAGFQNIQVDLIYGLKKGIRTLQIADEIQTLHDAGAGGISAYALTLEKRTLLAHSHLADEENAADEYDQILQKCDHLGFKQRETSNFSCFESKHNNIYWHGSPYIGIGTGAHGLLPGSAKHPYGIRYKVGENKKERAPGDDLLLYSLAQEKQQNFSLVYDSPRSIQEYREEMFFTLLRTEQGIPLRWLKEMCSAKEPLTLLCEDAKIKRALAEEKIFLNEHFIYLNAAEKIRGDAWTTHFIRLLS